MYKSYDDRVTWKLISTASKILSKCFRFFTFSPLWLTLRHLNLPELDIETVLEALGNHFIKYVCFQGYDKILRSLGTNLHDFLANIDYLHEHLSNVFVGMRAPSFRITHGSEGTMHLHYHSERKGSIHPFVCSLSNVPLCSLLGLGPFVRGLVTTASNDFFRTEVIVNQLSATEDGHIVFEVINKSIDPNSGELSGTYIYPMP